MPNNYQVLDAYSSVLTFSSSVVGTAHQQIVQIGSVLTPLTVNFSGSPSVSGAVTIVGNPSVSGTVGASIVGQLPAGIAVLGSIATLQGTNPWRTLGSVSGTVDIGTSSGSVIAFQGGAWTPSVSGTVGASIIGNLPAGEQVLGSVATLQGTNPWRTLGSVSGTVGASIIGSLPAGEQVLGSVAVLQGTNPWRTLGSVSGTVNIGTLPNASVSGTVGASIIGLPVVRPYALEANRIEGYAAVTSTSVTTLVAAAGASTRNYITDIWVANTGSVTTLVTFTSQGGASVLGYTIAPAGSGSNLPGLVTPIRTGENETFGIQAGALTSVLYVTVKGFKA